MQELRLLQEKDLESIYPIYVYYVKTSTAIFDVVQILLMYLKNIWWKFQRQIHFMSHLIMMF